MRKLLLVLLIGVTLTACQKEDAQTTQPESVGTIYTRIQVVDQDGTLTYTPVAITK